MRLLTRTSEPNLNRVWAPSEAGHGDPRSHEGPTDPGVPLTLSLSLYLYIYPCIYLSSSLHKFDELVQMSRF